MKKKIKSKFDIFEIMMILFFFVLLSIISIVLFSIDEDDSFKLKFSHESGFYDEPFSLTITTGSGVDIYYTLDGSVPTENDNRYEKGIYIDDATTHDNTICMYENVSTAFRLDLQKKYGTIDEFPGYKTPDYLVDKCTVLRIMVKSKDGRNSYYTKTYFVGNTAKKYCNNRVVSLVTDPDNLFDYDNGIYVTGAEFDRYIEENSGNIYSLWRQWKANYTCRGKAWEREAVIQGFNNSNVILDKTVGIRIRGGVSRALLPKSFTIYARKEYDGTDELEYNFFENEYNPKRIALNSGGNQPEIQLNDKMISERVNKLSFSTMNYVPCDLFINGEYWGFYFISEKYDGEYIQQYYGVNKDNVVMVKKGSLEIGNEEDINLYNDMVSYICDNDMGIDENYYKACSLIDIDSYIDYYATLIYIARCEDWPHSNYALWRSRAVSQKEYEDGKWRWMLYDCNSSSLAFGDASVEHNTLQWVLEDDRMFSSLWQNNRFKEQFKAKILEIADTCFDSYEMQNYVNNFKVKYEEKLEESWKRYYGIDNDMKKKFAETLQETIEFFKNRKTVVESWDELDF